jgi:tetratricopeptide (TPR) repeat protein
LVVPLGSASLAFWGFSGFASPLWGQTSGAPLLAEPSTSAPQIGQRELEQWIEQLGSSQYKTRQSAFLSLLAAGTEATDAIVKATRSEDPEIRDSAKWLVLLGRLQGGTTQPSEAFSQLTLVKAGDFYTVLQLASDRKWPQLLGLLELLTPAQRAALIEDRDDFNRLLETALDQHQEAMLPLLADRLLPPLEAEAYRVYWKSQGVLDYQGQRRADGEEGSEPSMESQVQSSEIQSVRRFWEGDPDQAFQSAVESGQKPLAESIAIRSFRWELLTPELQVNPPDGTRIADSETFSNEIRKWLALRWCGRSEQAAKWQESLQMVPAGAFDPVAWANQQVALGEAERGVEGLQRDYPSLAAACWSLMGRTEKMLDLVEMEGVVDDASMTAFDFETWFMKQSKLLASQELSQAGIGRFLALIDVSNTLARLGYTEYARRLDRLLVGVAGSDSRESQLMAELMRQWSSGSRRDRAMEQVLLQLEKLDGRTSLTESVSELISLAYPDWLELGPMMLQQIRDARPNSSWKSALVRLERLYHGSLPEGWKMSNLEEFCWQMQQLPAASSLPETEKILGKLALDAGHPGLALQILSVAPQLPDVTELMSQAALRMGDSQFALRRLEAESKSGGIPLEHRFQWIDLLQRSGQTQAAEDVQHRVLAIMPEPSMVQAELRDLENKGMADPIRQLAWNLWQLQIATPEAASSSYTLALADSYKERDPTRARDLVRAAIQELLRDGTQVRVLPSAILYYHSQEAGYRWRAAIEAGNLAEAEQAITDAFRMRPEDIDQPIAATARAEAFFGKPVADRWLARYADFHREHLAKWPKDAMFHNNLAWLLARTDRQLQEALEHATKACQLRPDEPTYLDTLAEVQFRLKDFDAAIATAEQCLKLEHKDPHAKRQWNRFVEGKRAAQSKAAP